MGLGGISLWQLLIVLLIVIVIFGTKRLSSLGSDLGGAVKGFRKAMSDSEKDAEPEKIDKPDAQFNESSSGNAEKASATGSDNNANS
ncbi:MAG: twin-arginine translocase TatA/TatE family subunit [Gammaproteobacteria bacterium]|jgi:sec-independent protein translocase protein TatA